MRPSEVSVALEALLPAGRPVYLWGPPGVGKSSVVRQAAERLDLGLVDVRATLLDPVDLRGLPAVSDGAAVWCPPAFLPRGGAGVLFLDELAQAPPLVQAACLQLVLDRRLGEYELPAGWSVVAASNRAVRRQGVLAKVVGGGERVLAREPAEAVGPQRQPGHPQAPPPGRKEPSKNYSAVLASGLGWMV